MCPLDPTVNIPKYNRERRTEEDTGRQPKNKGDEIQTQVHRATQQRQTKPLSYADAVRKKNITHQRRKDQKQHSHGYENYTSSVYLNIKTKEIKWLEDAWVGRLNNLAMFKRLVEELRWELGMDIAPKYLGDDLVLLPGLTEAEAE